MTTTARTSHRPSRDSRELEATDPGSTQSMWECVLAVNPRRVDALHALGRILMERGDQDGAFTLLRRALHEAPSDAAIHRDLGKLHVARCNYGGALVHYWSALRLRPRDAQSMYEIGLIHSYRGDAGAAAACFRKVLKLEPHFVPACYRLGVALQEQQRYEEAAVFLRQALELAPDHAEAQAALTTVATAQGAAAQKADGHDWGWLSGAMRA